MKQNIYLVLSGMAVFSMTLTSCELVKGIFEAGVWVGILVVVLIIGLIIWLITRFRK